MVNAAQEKVDARGYDIPLVEVFWRAERKSPGPPVGNQPMVRSLLAEEFIPNDSVSNPAIPRQALKRLDEKRRWINRHPSRCISGRSERIIGDPQPRTRTSSASARQKPRPADIVSRCGRPSPWRSLDHSSDGSQ